MLLILCINYNTRLFNLHVFSSSFIAFLFRWLCPTVANNAIFYGRHLILLFVYIKELIISYLLACAKVF